MKTKRILLSILLLLISFGLFACKKLSVEIKGDNTLEVGSTIDLTANASIAGATLEWSTSDAKIATVSDGKVTGVAAGTVTITVKATNGKKEASASIQITVKAKGGDTPGPDPVNNKPVISGASDKTIEKGSTFIPLAGITATDVEDGDLTSKIKYSGNVRTSAVGVYEAKYSVTDSDGNTTEVTITVTVVFNDNDAPLLTGTQNKAIIVGDTEFNLLAGVVAQDTVDGDLTSSIQVTGDVNVWVVGEYEVEYSVKDKSNNETKSTRKITVGVGEFKFNDPEDKIFERVDGDYQFSIALENINKSLADFALAKLEFVAEVSADCELVPTITNGTSQPKLNLKAGSNTVTLYFRVKDAIADGLVKLATTAEVTFSNVKFAFGEAKDTEAPTINVPQDIEVVLPGDMVPLADLKKFVLEGVSAEDNIDGIVTAKLDVDFGDYQQGSYDEREVTIFVVDSSNNRAEAKRTVKFAKVYDTKLIADPEFNTEPDAYDPETHIGWGLNGGGGNPELKVVNGELVHHNTTLDNPGWDSASSPFYRTTTEVLAAYNWYLLKFDVKAEVARKMTVRIGLETTEALGWIENFTGGNNTPFNLTTEWQTCYVLFYIHAEESQAHMPVIKFELKIGTFTWGGEEQGNTVYFDNLQVYLLTNENSAPKLTINDDLPTSFGKGEAKPDLTKYVIAYDREDAQNIELTAANITENIDMNTPGTYEVTYKVADSEGAESTISLNIRVLAEKDTEAPVLAEAANIQKEYDQFSEAPDLTKLITATDNVEGEITITSAMIKTDANINVAGTYDVKYTVKDTSGNVSELTITLVVKDKEAPTITGKDTIKLFQGESITAEDIAKILIAKDNVDLIIQVKAEDVKGLDTVDFNTPGEYPITVEVKDSSGNVGVFNMTVLVRVNGATQLVLGEQLIDLSDLAIEKAESCTVAKDGEEYKITIDSLGQWASANKCKFAGLELVEGKTYALKFVAKADQARQVKMNLGIGLWADPWMDYFTLVQDSDAVITLGTEYAEYVIFFTYDKENKDGGPSLEFCVGPVGHEGDVAGNTIYYKELAIYSTKETAAEIATEVKDFLLDELTGENADVAIADGVLTINPTDVGTWASYAKLKLTGLPLEDGKTYELRITAKADEPRQLQFNIGISLWADPWTDKYTLAEEGSNIFVIDTQYTEYIIRFTADKENRDSGPAVEFCVGNTYHDGDKVGNVIYINQFKIFEIETDTTPVEPEDPATKPIVLDDFESYADTAAVTANWAKRYDGVNYTEGFELIENNGNKAIKFNYASDKKYLFRFIGTFPELTDDYKYVRFKAVLASEETPIEVWLYWNGSQNGINFVPQEIYCEKDGYYYCTIAKWSKKGSDINGFAIGYNYKGGEVAYFDNIEFVIDMPDTEAPVIKVSDEVMQMVGVDGLKVQAGADLRQTFAQLRAGISATDNVDGEIAILDDMIDLGGLNLEKAYAGKYTITLTVKDEAKNTAKLELPVVVEGDNGLLTDLLHREHKGENATVELADDVLTVDPTNVGEWASYAKIKLTNLNLEYGKSYELRIKAKADEARQIQFNIGIGLWAEPWTDYFTLASGSESTLLLGTDYQDFVIKFTYNKEDRDSGPIIEFCVGNTYHAGDKAGNKIYLTEFAIYSSELDTSVDLTPPTISINPLVLLSFSQMTFMEGDNKETEFGQLLNGITATDNVDGNIPVTMDNVDLDGLNPANLVAGDYLIKVTVKDSSGNEASQELNLHVSKYANLTIDFLDGTVGSGYTSADWTREKYDNGWVAISGNMNCREKDGVRVCNIVTGYSMTYRYTYNKGGEAIGLANKLTLKAGNYFSPNQPIDMKIILIDVKGNSHYIYGDADNMVTFNVTEGLIDLEFTFDDIDVRAIAFAVKSTANASAYLYLGDIELTYVQQ